jgi:polyphenol oxidase
VHGIGVEIVKTEKDIANSEGRFDALVSDRANTLVGVKTADCVPFLIGDPNTGSYAAIHSGWKGTAGKIAARALGTLQTEFGSHPGDMICAIGPCASGENYEVGQDVIEAFAAAFRGHEKYFTPTQPDRALVDLRLANNDLLVEAGVNAANIFVAPFCTIERTDLFFSYRVEKKLYGKTGRLLSVIGRRK